MASLQHLPTELLIELLIARPTAQTLLQLSSINRHMRAVWLEHSKHIIIANYKQRIPHIRQAIALTLTEVQSGEIPKSPNDHSSPAAPKGARDQPPPPIRLYLPRVVHNARLASAACDDLAKITRAGDRSWQATEDPYTDSLRAYYLSCHIALAWDHPQLRPTVMTTLSETPYDMLQECEHLFFPLTASPSSEIHSAHAIWERIPRAEQKCRKGVGLGHHKVSRAIGVGRAVPCSAMRCITAAKDPKRWQTGTSQSISSHGSRARDTTRKDRNRRAGTVLLPFKCTSSIPHWLLATS